MKCPECGNGDQQRLYQFTGGRSRKLKSGEVRYSPEEQVKVEVCANCVERRKQAGDLVYQKINVRHDLLR